MKDNILILGGTSFVSRALALSLIKAGCLVDIVTRGKHSLDYDGYHEHIICDRRNYEAVKNKLSGRSYEYIFDINGYFPDDIRWILEVLDKSKIKKYLFCSSGSVYTFKDKITSTSSERVPEDWDEPFGLTKRKAEDVLIESGVPYIIIRPSYIYGERDEIPRACYLFKCVDEGKQIRMLKNKDIHFNFIYVEELAKLFISAAKSPLINRCYNGCNDEEVTDKKLMKVIEETSGKEADILWLENEKDKRFDFPYDEDGLMTNKGLKEDNLYVPHMPYKEGLKSIYDFMHLGCNE